MTTIRLHLPSIPHTITRDDYSHCAFTGKVQRFSPMMRSVGYEVYHYGVETSVSGANTQIDLFSLHEWNELRVQSFKKLFPELSDIDIQKRIHDPTQFIGDLGHIDTPLYVEFNRRFRESLLKHYRSKSTDIICIPFGHAYSSALDGLDVVSVESGIGYLNAYSTFRIYESYAFMHHDYSHIQDTEIQYYWFVCPNYYNSVEWPLQLNPDPSTVGFLGRIQNDKGLYIIVELARRFKNTTFIICGQGDPMPYLIEPNIIYKKPIHGTERGIYLSNLSALIAPSRFLEPFCGVSVEAQLCGTPVISSDYGAFVENIEQFKTGVRCRTLSDFCYGVQMALDKRFDRQYIHNRAITLFDMYNVAKKYKYAFDSIMDIFNGTNGWYSPDTHIDNLNKE
jgi:glycosyltransferase involved in cell wall biosynthesis